VCATRPGLSPTAPSEAAPTVKLPHQLQQPPIWREGLWGLEASRLVRDPIMRGDGLPDAGGQPVLLIPGFLAGDGSLGVMTGWLRRTGHHTSRAGIRSNVDCSEAVAGRLVDRLEAFAERRGEPVAIVGQSRGGSLARVLAVRRPDLVSGIVTLGSPVLAPLAIHPLVRLQVAAVSALGTVGAPGLFRHTCLAGGCCEPFRADSGAPVPAGVGYVSVYSRRDGIVDWRACLDPAAELVEVDASHVGMAANAEVYTVVASALERFRAGEATPAPAQAPARAA
jgi:triacylglycerol lipase